MSPQPGCVAFCRPLWQSRHHVDDVIYGYVSPQVQATPIIGKAAMEMAMATLYPKTHWVRAVINYAWCYVLEVVAELGSRGRDDGSSVACRGADLPLLISVLPIAYSALSINFGDA